MLLVCRFTHPVRSICRFTVYRHAAKCNTYRYVAPTSNFSTSRRVHAENSRSQSQHVGQPPKLFPTSELIKPESLADTLEAHREANRTLLISKIDEDGKRQRLHIRDEGSDVAVTLDTPTPQSPVFEKFKRLDLVRQPDVDDLHVPKHGSRARTLTREWLPGHNTIPTKRWPWASKRQALIVSREERLTDEIDTFDRWLTPTAEESLAADAAINEIKAILQRIATQRNARWKVDVIGSRSSGCATPLSDIDLTVRVENDETTQDSELTESGPKQFLRKLCGDLLHDRIQLPPEARGLMIDTFIPTAKVPVISGTHTPSGLQFQIQNSVSCYGSLESARHYMKQHPSLRPLFKVIRQTLKMRGLTNGSWGGITSYPLLIMIVAALKLGEGKIAALDSGAQLRYFLDMYSSMDFRNIGVSMFPLQLRPKTLRAGHPNLKRRAVEEDTDGTKIIGRRPSLKRQAAEMDTDGAKFVGTSQQEPAHPEQKMLHEQLDIDNVTDRYADIFIVNPRLQYLPVIQDPADPENNLGKSIYLIKDLQATLIQLKEDLERRMDHETGIDIVKGKFDNRARAWRVPLLNSLLGADYGLFMGERLGLRNYASSFADSNRSAPDGE